MDSARPHPRTWLFKLSWALLVSAVIAFSAGGRILHEVTKTDRILDESAGIALAILLCVLGAVARYFAHEHRVAKEGLQGTEG
jgi:hypothetical protein